MNKKYKIAILCNFSNNKVKSCLHIKMSFFELLIRKILHKETNLEKLLPDYGVWNTNAFLEYQNYLDDFEFYVISPFNHLRSVKQQFDLDGIHYYFFRNEDSEFFSIIKSKLKGGLINRYYYKNRKNIAFYISRIKPDIVYLIGAENPYYSLAAIDIDKTIPVFVQLQTLLNDPDFEKNYPIQHDDYLYRAECEYKVLKRANYIGSSVSKFIHIIKQKLIPNASFLKTRLAVGERINVKHDIVKKYDFVYFSANINKAFDLALEGFVLTKQEKKDCNLLVVGYYDEEYKQEIDRRINKLNLTESICFTGRLESHEDVILKIQEAQFALLPLKIDITSGTIREAMACGLPVITTITKEGTENLNKKRETVLLSEIGDHLSLSKNMLKIMNNKVLTEKLIKNGKQLIMEEYDNEIAVQQQLLCLSSIIEQTKNNKEIPRELFSE